MIWIICHFQSCSWRKSLHVSKSFPDHQQIMYKHIDIKLLRSKWQIQQIFEWNWVWFYVDNIRTSIYICIYFSICKSLGKYLCFENIYTKISKESSFINVNSYWLSTTSIASNSNCYLREKLLTVCPCQ